MAVGEGVKEDLVGRKLLFSHLFLVMNAFCKERYYAKCTHYSYFGSRQDGGFSEYLSVPEFNLGIAWMMMQIYVKPLCSNRLLLVYM